MREQRKVAQKRVTARKAKTCQLAKGVRTPYREHLKWLKLRRKKVTS